MVAEVICDTTDNENSADHWNLQRCSVWLTWAISCRDFSSFSRSSTAATQSPMTDSLVSLSIKLSRDTLTWDHRLTLDPKVAGQRRRQNFVYTVPLWSPAQSDAAAGTAPASGGVYTRIAQRRFLSRLAERGAWNTQQKLPWCNPDWGSLQDWLVPFHGGLVLHLVWVELVILWLGCLLLNTA